MNKIRPWYRWHVNRWRNSPRVLAMSLAAHGAYRNLLDAAWDNGGKIPNNADVIWRYALAQSKAEFAKVSAEVLSMFTVSEDGKWLTNETLTDEWNDATDWFKKKSEAGKKGSSARWSHGNDIAPPSQPDNDATAAPMAKDSTSPHHTLPNNTKTRSKPSARKARGPDEPTDPRWHHCVEILHRYWDRWAKAKIRFELWFDDPGGKQLKNIFQRHKSMTVEEFTQCVANRARSPGAKHEEPFYLWGGHILEWVGGPKGNGQVSKDAERNARNKAEIIRGITGQGPGGNAVHSGPAVPERDNRGSDGVLEVVPDRSRTVVAGSDS